MTTLVVMGVYLSQIVSVSSVQAQREREAELLRVGLAYQNAIRAYYQDAATASERYPLALTDLVKDPRVPQARRYLRKLYADPLTQSTDWGLIFDPQKRIVGVYSKAVGTPMNQADFSDQYAGFAQQTSYRGWIFKYQPDIGMSGGRR